MSVDEQYKLLDFGGRRRLEQFGPWVLDRPCPTARRAKQAPPEVWFHAHAQFRGRREDAGRWFMRAPLPPRWTVAFGRLRFELKLTDFGHVGLFPEQAENWAWLEETVAAIRPSHGDPPPVLNLFAYTGGSTLAAAAAGAEVVHVDAAKNVVAWAKRNAAWSQLSEAPIHWVVEDALKFVKRELRRGKRYEALILDPPSYGHGRRGEVWRLKKHLPLLLDYCARLTDGRPAFLLLTCHTPDFDAERLAGMITQVFGPADELLARNMVLRAESGGELPSGAVVRWKKR